MVWPLLAWLTRTHATWAGMVVATGLAIGGSIYWVRTHWDKTKELAKHPFAKYVAISVIAHVVLGVWAYFSNILDSPRIGVRGSTVVVQLVEGGDDESSSTAQPHENSAWDPPVADAVEPKIPAPAAAKINPATTPRPEFAPADDHRVDSPLANLDQIEPDLLPDEPFADDMTQPSPPFQETLREATPTIADKVANFEPKPISAIEPMSQPVRPVEPTPSHVDPQLAIRSNELPDPEVTSREPDQDLTSKNQPPLGDVAAMNPMRRQDDLFPDPTPRLAHGTRALQPTASATPPKAALRPVTSGWQGAGRDRVPVATLGTPRRRDGRPVPDQYRDRWAENRLQLARQRGGDESTELGVEQSLKWLAAIQAADGRWDASQFGSGEMTFVEGQDRRDAGREADSGISGLALLCFLGAGHTHLHGEYAEHVQRGLEYLVRVQRTRDDGGLMGAATHYAAMYCHGIATLAISEAYSLTGDERLQVPLQRAIGFTIAAQHPTSGGWRYRPYESGDTSQLGWQLMSLTSAHHSGATIPARVWTGAGNFLLSVAAGHHGGLASYRPGERISAPMTAEALLCRLLLGTSTGDPLVEESAGYLMQHLPGAGRANYYYWYYGTLALYHLQDENWERWNTQVKRELLRRQRTDGSLSGSWDADSVWGASGGRVYTTALATLTLEVYYRFRPFAEPRPVEHTAWRSK